MVSLLVLHRGAYGIGGIGYGSAGRLNRLPTAAAICSFQGLRSRRRGDRLAATDSAHSTGTVRMRRSSMNRCGRSRPGKVDDASACQVGTRPASTLPITLRLNRSPAVGTSHTGQTTTCSTRRRPYRLNYDVATLRQNDDVNDQDVDNGLWSKIHAFGRRELRLNNGEREAGNDIALLEVRTFDNVVPRWSVPLRSFHAASYSSPSWSSAASSGKTVGVPWQTSPHRA